jgi:ATP-binding cassette subfamily B protein
MVGALGFAAVTLLEPWPLKVVFDSVLLHRKIHFHFLIWQLNYFSNLDPHQLLIGTVLAMLVLAILRGQFYYMQNVLAATSGQDLVMSVRRELFAQLQRLPLSFHRRAHAGDLLMRLTGDILLLREMVVNAIVTLMSQTLVVIGMVVVMGYMDFPLMLVALALMPVTFLAMLAFRVRLIDAAHRQRKREGVLASTAQEILQGIQLVQANTAEGHENERFKEMNRRSQRASVKSARIEAEMNRVVLILIAGGMSAVLWLGTERVLAGRLTPGLLIVFFTYVQNFYKPLRQLSKMTERMAKATACGTRVLELLESEPEIQDNPRARVLRQVEGRVTFRGVTMAYGGGPPVLREVSLEVAPREKVALVGPTGVGKSTLLALVPRFYDPLEGEVLLDGVPIRSLKLRFLRRQISFLTQDATVLGDPVRDNIAYGARDRDGPPPTAEEIELAAGAARAHEFIMALPEGYDTVVGERGATLSGGQRQRIAIARALLRHSPVLLLDEPMTGLDPLSERDVLYAFENLAAGRTTIMVAHHMSTVLHADRIVFLRDGRIAEEGPHETLLARGGPYAEFYITQWSRLNAGRTDRGADLEDLTTG